MSMCVATSINRYNIFLKLAAKGISQALGTVKSKVYFGAKYFEIHEQFSCNKYFYKLIKDFQYVQKKYFHTRFLLKETW